MTRCISEKILLSAKTSNNSFHFPLYIYPLRQKGSLFELEQSSQTSGRYPNLATKFITDFSSALKLAFIPDGAGDLSNNFGPEDVFAYMYAVLYSPIYRSRYTNFLKRDFARLPLTRDAKLFARLCALGKRLVALHLMEAHAANICAYPVAGNNRVDKVEFKRVPSLRATRDNRKLKSPLLLSRPRARVGRNRLFGFRRMVDGRISSLNHMALRDQWRHRVYGRSVAGTRWSWFRPTMLTVTGARRTFFGAMRLE